jgi:hypothetical protein
MVSKWRLAECCFEPEVVDAMRTAYRMACEAPQVKDAMGATTAIVAERIIELAQAGETDPSRLCTRALRRVAQ